MNTCYAVCIRYEDIEDEEQDQNEHLLCCVYWAIQAGLLSPLTFARHHLSRLAAFTSDVYFLHNGRR